MRRREVEVLKQHRWCVYIEQNTEHTQHRALHNPNPNPRVSGVFLFVADSRFERAVITTVEDGWMYTDDGYLCVRG